MSQGSLFSKIEMRLKSKVATITRFAEQNIILDASGGLFFVRHNILVVSDLHLEKGSYLQSFASPISNYDTADTLLRLNHLIDVYNPHTLICLGDSFHDLNAFSRIETNTYKQLELLISKVNKWIWILGNHDPRLPENLQGVQLNSYQIDDLLLLHEPEIQTKSDTAQIVGHYHPKMTYKAPQLSVTGRCFVSNSRLLIMPSFGSYTGGLDIRDKVMVNLLGCSNINRYLINQNKIWPL